VVAIDINGEIFAVARWTGRKTREIVGRTADIEHLPTVAEAQQHIAGLVRIKISGFIDNIAEDFARPAEQARRLAVELAELPPLEDKWTPYAIKRRLKLRKPTTSCWRNCPRPDDPNETASGKPGAVQFTSSKGPRAT
jgi:hypothetical protein